MGFSAISRSLVSNRDRQTDRALVPLIRLWKEGSLGSVQVVAVLGLGGRQPLINEAPEHWRQTLARSLPLAHFASLENIQLINLTQL
jgi:hypothetical protein